MIGALSQRRALAESFRRTVTLLPKLLVFGLILCAFAALEGLFAFVLLLLSSYAGFFALPLQVIAVLYIIYLIIRYNGALGIIFAVLPIRGFTAKTEFYGKPIKNPWLAIAWYARNNSFRFLINAFRT